MNYRHTLFMILFICSFIRASDNRMYFCTATDNKFFAPLLNLIGSIHKHDFERLGEVAIFDLGLTIEQKKQLGTIAKTKVYQLDIVHPQLLTQFKTRPYGKFVPGWYAWKAVAIKQVLEHRPRVLWIDAGTTILRSLAPLFDHIEEQGYFFHNGSDCPIVSQITNYLIEKCKLRSVENNWILKEETRGVEAGLMGFSQKLYDSCVVPMYELAKDLRAFADDGSARGGFGNARHDTSVYSVMVNLHKFHIHQHGVSPQQQISLLVHGNPVPYHITYLKECITPLTSIYISRNDVNLAEYAPYIRKEHVS